MATNVSEKKAKRKLFKGNKPNGSTPLRGKKSRVSQMTKLKRTEYWKGMIGKIVAYAILLAFSYIFLYPLLSMFSMSFMSQADLINPDVNWIPRNFSLNNFKVAGQVLTMPQSMINSVWVSVLFALAQTVVSTLTGYAFAKFKFPGRGFLFVMLLLSFIIPVPLVTIPRVMVFTTLQDLTSIQMIGTIIPQFFFSILGQGVNSAILILICYNFFNGIPPALDEAASIDGANSRQIFWHITIKLSVSTIVTAFLFAFVWNWNETYSTSTFIRTGVDLLPQRLGIFESVFAQRGAELSTDGGGEARVNEAYKMAGTLISITPLLILYFFTQRLFIEGIENVGIKG